MAAKKPVKKPKKTAKSAKSSKTSTAKATRSAAQNKAYQAASKTAIQKAQLKVNTRALQERRLQAAIKVQGKAKAKGREAFAARIKVLAIHRTYLQTVYGKQQTGLRVQAAHRLFKAQSVATNKQFAYLGEAIHARTTTLQTLTDAQALTAEQRLAMAARRAVLGRRSNKPKTTPKRKAATSRSPYASIGAAAGKAAAARIKRPAKAPVSKTRKASRLTPAVNPEWITAGNDLGEENCVAVAIANHLLYHTGHRVTDEQIADLHEHPNSDLIAVAVCYLRFFSIWEGIELEEFTWVGRNEAVPGMIVGFSTKTGPHCGVLLPGNKVVSWGEIVPLESEIEEAWTVTWMTKTR